MWIDPCLKRSLTPSHHQAGGLGLQLTWLRWEETHPNFLGGPTPLGVWDLSSLTQNRTPRPCSGSSGVLTTGTPELLISLFDNSSGAITVPCLSLTSSCVCAHSQAQTLPPRCRVKGEGYLTWTLLKICLLLRRLKVPSEGGAGCSLCHAHIDTTLTQSFHMRRKEAI